MQNRKLENGMAPLWQLFTPNGRTAVIIIDWRDLVPDKYGCFDLNTKKRVGYIE